MAQNERMTTAEELKRGERKSAMIITELYIRNFGKISEEHFYFRDGIQIISGENEYGKTTIHAFIRAMLFGLERGRGRAAAKDDFSRYEPWENPACYAGVMRFVCGGRNFRLERNFGRFTKYTSLVCEDDGEELSVEHGDLSMLMGGLTEGLFDSTVSVRQLQARPGQELAEALENYAANYYETGAGEIDLASAFERLKEKRRLVEKEIKEDADRSKKVCAKLRQECSYLERDMNSLRAEYDEKDNRLKEMENFGQRQEEVPEETGGERKSTVGAGNMAVTGAAGVFVGVLGLAWSMILGLPENVPIHGDGIFGSALPVEVFSVVILLVGVVVLAAGMARWKKERVSKKESARQSGRSLEFDPGERMKAAEAADRLKWEMERIRNEWREKEIRCENLREQCEETEEEDVPEHLLRKKRVLEIAEEELREAAKDTGNQTMRLLKNRTSEIFTSITDGKYEGVDVDSELRISVWDGRKKIPADRLSRGTVEQIYFSVRMAAADLLLEEPVPVLLDDIFAFYDDKRLESALKWLREWGKQVIIFSCHKREEEIVKRELFS